MGKGECRDELIEYAKKLNAKNIYFEEYVAKNQVSGVLEAADCLYIGAKDCPLYRYGVSMNKLYDYMVAGRPIIYGINAPHSEAISCGCAISVEPQNAQALCLGIMRLKMMSPKQREDMGARGRAYATKQRNYRRLASEFAAALQEK